jgi:hypothetical protein
MYKGRDSHLGPRLRLRKRHNNESKRRGRYVGRLGGFFGLMSRAAPSHVKASITGRVSAGASPPYGVVKLASVFLADFHFL